MKRLATGDGRHVSLRLDYESFAKGKAFLAAMRAAGPQHVIQSINQIALTWQREIQRHMPVEDGTARMSVQVRKAEQKPDGRIVGAVGTNTDYVQYLEFGSDKPRIRGLIKALSLWKEGMEPIKHWYAKDMGIADLEAKRDRAKTDKSRANYQARINKANESSTEEFAPPFRGSWQMIAADVVRRLRSNLARLIRTGKLSEGQP